MRPGGSRGSNLAIVYRRIPFAGHVESEPDLWERACNPKQREVKL